MKHTYIFKKGDKLYVVISDEKVPDFYDNKYLDRTESFRDKLLFENDLKSWLSKSTTYEVFKGEEEKFNGFMMIQASWPLHKEQINAKLKRYHQIPNEVVKIEIRNVAPDPNYRYPPYMTLSEKQYAFFVQPEEKRNIVAMINEDKFNPKELDLWPSDRDIQKMIYPKGERPDEYVDLYEFQIIGAHILRDQLKKDYILIPKSK